MKIHANAALTVAQRQRVRELHQEGVSQAELARRYGVDRRTIARWVKRENPRDRSTAPHEHGRRVVTEAYRDAVIAERQAHPHYGPRRIAYALRERFPTANTATVWRILHAAGLSRPTPKKTDVAADSGGTPPRAVGHSGIARDSRRA